MLGEAPRTGVLAAIRLARRGDSAAIRFARRRAPLSDRDKDRQRLAPIRRDSVRNAALRHDWVHRLRAVFDALGIPPTEGMLAREGHLRLLADLALGADFEDNRTLG
jgi:hypothetical protein